MHYFGPSAGGGVGRAFSCLFMWHDSGCRVVGARYSVSPMGTWFWGGGGFISHFGRGARALSIDWPLTRLGDTLWDTARGRAVGQHWGTRCGTPPGDAP